MIRITVLCAGKLKEKYLADAAAEYARRLSRYARLEIVETADEKTPEEASPAEEERIRETEGRRMEERLPKDAMLITLSVQGRQMSSEELAGGMERWMTEGRSHLCFVIGGSLGLSESLRRRTDLDLSFSRMTFPHQLMRVILLEQIYRSFRIMRNEPYHK